MTQVSALLIVASLGLATIGFFAAAAEAKSPPEFQPCLACHSVDVGTNGMAGPNLANLIGRPIGGDPEFNYSSVLSDAGQNTTWTVELLERFLEDPEGMFSGMWMSYPGIDDLAVRQEIAKYLSTFSDMDSE